jgi:hypothetical protein
MSAKMPAFTWQFCREVARSNATEPRATSWSFRLAARSWPAVRLQRQKPQKKRRV